MAVKTRALVAGLVLFVVSVVIVLAAEGTLVATLGNVSADAVGERLVQDGILIWKEVLV